MDAMPKKCRFRLVRHRRIKLKTRADQWLQSFRLTSCLTRCDNYYFSPSQVSVISSLPPFKFKTPFDYHNVFRHHKITVKTVQKRSSDKQRSKPLVKPSVTTTTKPVEDIPRSSPKDRKKGSKDSNDSTVCYYKTRDDNLVTINANVDSSDANDVPIEPNVSPDDNDYHSIDNNPQPSPRVSPQVSPKATKERNVSNIERLLDLMIDKKLKEFEQSLRQISDSMIRTSTPVTANRRDQTFDPNVSAIGGRLRNITVRSVGIQAMDVSKADQMTQTLQMSHKLVQTDMTLGRVASMEISSSDSTSTKTSIHTSHTTTDSDPECPFPAKFRSFLTKLF